MKDTAASVSRLYSSNASRKKKEAVGKILDAILTKQYPKADGISFDQLLEWDLWPSFIVVFSKLRILYCVCTCIIYDIVCVCGMHVCVCVCVCSLFQGGARGCFCPLLSKILK